MPFLYVTDRRSDVPRPVPCRLLRTSHIIVHASAAYNSRTSTHITGCAGAFILDKVTSSIQKAQQWWHASIPVAVRFLLLIRVAQVLLALCESSRERRRQTTATITGRRGSHGCSSATSTGGGTDTAGGQGRHMLLARVDLPELVHALSLDGGQEGRTTTVWLG